MADPPTTSAPAPQLERATVAFFRRHPPFNEMDEAAVRRVAAGARMGYYPKDATIVGPESGVVRALFVVQRGLARQDSPDAVEPRDGMQFGPGDMFPLNALLGGRATTSRYVASEDLFCYEIDGAAVDELMRTSPVFQRYATRRMDALLRQARSALRSAYGDEAISDRPMMRPLSSAVKRGPVTCPEDAPLRSALEIMARQRIGSVVAVDGAGAPKGIFTERDLVRHAAGGPLDTTRPISAFMTPDPISLPATATLYEAGVLMAQHGIRHLLVCEAGRLVGVISERSLFALQRMSMREVVTAIDLADSRDDLRAAAEEIRGLAKTLIAQGVGAEALTGLISTLNDRLTGRVLTLEAARHDLAGIRVCWLALGSEGRHEQTISTDQDNAILFDAPGDAQAVRSRLVPFAKSVNVALDACGFPLCKGDIMAGNPAWCLSAAEWRARFGDWIRNPLPEALLNASIFFDFRGVWGELGLAHELRAWLIGMTQEDQRFLRIMTENALASRPPLGFFGDFQTSGEGEMRGTIDLKAQGTRVFTDAARIVALASGADAQNTAARLRHAAGVRQVPAEEVEALVDAFYFILLLRLRQQHLGTAPSSGNRIDPRALHELDQRILKEAFRQGRKLQKRLALDYQLR
jgi:CBS domain-containing protein